MATRLSLRYAEEWRVTLGRHNLISKIQGLLSATQSIELGDVVYEMDWLLLTMSERKDLLMIMMRSMRPVKLTSSFLVTLSLDSYSNVSIRIEATFGYKAEFELSFHVIPFLQLLKTSYSAFNVLQQR